MPRFDGTGPQGRGPMTGQARGFCILKAIENTDRIQGLAGIDGKPVGKLIEDVKYFGKEVAEMPRGDGTGPAGLGPMTGRAAGFCVGLPVPGYMNPAVSRVGYHGPGVPPLRPYGTSLLGYRAGYGAPYTGWVNPWIRRGFGFGRGFGRGWGRGRGRRGFGYWW